MGKEHFIETFGVPLFTISTGGSGGAYTSLQIADAFPGLFDGVSISATFPDALSIALAGLDAHLLTRYFTVTDPAGFTDAQKLAITGYQSVQAFIDAANQAQRTDPVPDRKDIEGYRSARWNGIKWDATPCFNIRSESPLASPVRRRRARACRTRAARYGLSRHLVLQPAVERSIRLIANWRAALRRLLASG